MTALALVAGALVLLAPGRGGPRVPGRRHRVAGPGRDPGRPGPRRRRWAGPASREHALVPAAVAVAGAACLAAGGVVHGAVAAAVVCPVTWWALDRAQRRPRPRPDDPRLPVALDLVAAGLRGGRPPSVALARAAPAAGVHTCDDLRRVAGLLRLGAEPGQAWAAVRDGPLAPVATVAVRSADSGMRVASAFEELAAELRRDRRAAAAARAHRAGVQAMGPLAACFLPSFVCLGIVPVVVGIARHALGVLP